MLAAEYKEFFSQKTPLDVDQPALPMVNLPSPLLVNHRTKIALSLKTILDIKATNTAAAVLKPSSNANHHNTQDVTELCKQGRLTEALRILCFIDDHRYMDDSVYDCLLQGCLNNKALPEAKLVHAHMIQTALECTEVSLGNKILSIYAKCRILVDAYRVFLEIPERNIVSWTTMIAAYSRHGYAQEALDLFKEMQILGIKPNQFTFASVIPACTDLGTLKEVHEGIIANGFNLNVFVGNALVDMYAKCGSLVNARKVFDEMPHRDVVSWTSMVAGYAHSGHVEEALELFQMMPQRNVISWNAMIAGYAQSGCHDKALKLFWEMPERDVVSWNAMIAGYAQNGCAEAALSFYQQMQVAGLKPNSKTFASVISPCANLGYLEQARKIHEEVIRKGFQCDLVVGNALVDMYGKCGSVDDARNVFDNMPQRDAISWNAMIAGYAQNGHIDEALKLFQEMPEQNVVSWTAMISGYAQNGYSQESLKLFHEMQLVGVKPNSNTFASVLSACANLAALEQGIEIHDEVIRNGFQFDIFVRNALIDMYSKCGDIGRARNVFAEISQRCVVSWNAMISAYAMHGYGKEALKLFEEMKQSSINPNHITFVGVLSACCHAGLVAEGWRYFNCMTQFYHITPTMEHYSCMVDLLGRSGSLDEAQDFVNKMPVKPDVNVWRSLLGACRIHNNIELGEYVAERLFELDPENAAPYVLLSNIYATASRWDDVGKVRTMMEERRLKKNPGCTWIEVDNKVHKFYVGDRSHPQAEKIYAMLEILARQIEGAGYVPDTSFVLHDVDKEDKEYLLCGHSERLAIAFGLINTCIGTTIRIAKNLRVCGDCHIATKFISVVAEREIVVRDANRFHHFKDGVCSCGDYW